MTNEPRILLKDELGEKPITPAQVSIDSTILFESNLASSFNWLFLISFLIYLL